MEPVQIDVYHLIDTFSFFESHNFVIQRISLAWKVVLWFIIFISLVTGWMMKYLKLKHITQKSFKEQPINWMILTEEIVHLVSGSFILTSLLLSHTMGLSVGEWVNHFFNEFMTDRQYCWILINVKLLVIIYRGVNGVGMAVVRVLLLVMGDWVKFRIGQRKFFILSWVSVVAMSAAIVCLYCVESLTSRPLYFTCMGIDEHIEVRPGLSEDWKKFKQVLGKSCQNNHQAKNLHPSSIFKSKSSTSNHF